jgi:FkbM family methyltransferase
MRSLIRNITFKDSIHAHWAYAQYLVGAFLRYRKTYSNYLNVLLNIFTKKYPIKAKLRMGQSVILPDRMATYFLTIFQEQNKLTYDIGQDVVTMNLGQNSGSGPINLRFEGAVSNGDILATFVEHEYDSIPVRGNVIIDIGANIGDTALYFALKGASRVIAIEPFPGNHRLAEKNIKNNNFSEKIDLILAGCSGKGGELLLDPDFKSSIMSSATAAATGSSVPMLTLTDIIEIANDSHDLVLKMDCEGCEYDTIISSPNEILSKFKYIQIEYHYGYLDLKAKLERCNFKITVSRPMTNYRRQFMGYLYAERL